MYGGCGAERLRGAMCAAGFGVSFGIIYVVARTCLSPANGIATEGAKALAAALPRSGACPLMHFNLYGIAACDCECVWAAHGCGTRVACYPQLRPSKVATGAEAGFLCAAPPPLLVRPCGFQAITSVWTVPKRSLPHWCTVAS